MQLHGEDCFKWLASVTLGGGFAQEIIALLSCPTQTRPGKQNPDRRTAFPHLDFISSTPTSDDHRNVILINEPSVVIFPLVIWVNQLDLY